MCLLESVRHMFFMSKEDQVGMSASTLPPPGGVGVIADITGDVGQGPTAPAHKPS